ncbi:hypothetical protein GOBAR_DD00430 [Gossypium barbadense]|nr:hypothetical protein GOBAR_DD00430 [Gossypium barbadense]
MARPGTRIIQAKLVLVGDMGTGKTSLVLRFVKGQFFHHQVPPCFILYVYIYLLMKFVVVLYIIGSNTHTNLIHWQEGEEFAQENGMLFMETSAKTAENVNELFYEIGNTLLMLIPYTFGTFSSFAPFLCAAKKLATASPPNPSGVTLNHEETQERRGKLFCCIG